MAPDYAFRPMTAADLSLVRNWLETPEVVRWWGQPDEQYVLVSGDLDHPDMDQFIVALDDHRFGYIQCYALSPSNQNFASQPPKTRATDQFIHDPHLIVRHHYSTLLPQFPHNLLPSLLPPVPTAPD